MPASPISAPGAGPTVAEFWRPGLRSPSQEPGVEGLAALAAGGVWRNCCGTWTILRMSENILIQSQYILKPSGQPMPFIMLGSQSYFICLISDA